MPVYQVTTLGQSWLSASIARVRFIWQRGDQPGIRSPTAETIWSSIKEDILWEHPVPRKEQAQSRTRRSLTRLHIPKACLSTANKQPICISPRAQASYTNTYRLIGSTYPSSNFCFQRYPQALLTCLLRPDPRDQALIRTLPSRTHSGIHR